MGTECACVCVLMHVFTHGDHVHLSNPGLRELPPELGQLGNLWQLDIEDLSITNVPAEIRKEGRASAVLSPQRHSLSPLWENNSSLPIRTLGWKQWDQLQLHGLGKCCDGVPKAIVTGVIILILLRW
jgi:hypothetical protein